METKYAEKTAKESARDDGRDEVAQNPDLPPPPDGAIALSRGEWNDLPPNQLLEAIAYANCGNWTGRLDWFNGAEQTNAPMKPVTVGFADGIVLKCLVPPEQIEIPPGKDKRSQEFKYFGVRCKQVREIIAAAGIDIKHNDVVGRRLFAVKECSGVRARVPPPGDINHATVILCDRDPKLVGEREWYWQHIGVSFHEANLQTVLDLVRTDVFANVGLWLNDFDVTMDCATVVRCTALKSRLLGQGIKVLENADKVGLNCLTWWHDNNREKVYAKMVQQFESKEVRATVGHHISEWVETTGTRLAEARDATIDDGLMRCETTVYTDRNDWPIATAHKHLPATAAKMTEYCARQLDVVPPDLVLKTSHHQMATNWAANLKHTLIVVDTYYDRALVAYAKNDVTHKVCGTFVNAYARRRNHVLQKLTLGDHPVDVIYLHRGSRHQLSKQQLPPSAPSLAASARRRQEKKWAESKAEWLDRDMDYVIGVKRVEPDAEPKDGDQSDSESGEDEAEVEETDGDRAFQPVQLDVEAQVEAARQEERKRAEEEAMAAPKDYASTVDGCEIARYSVAPGSLLITSARYHRVSCDPSVPNPTEFPMYGGLEHHFQLPYTPEGIKSLLPNAVSTEAKERNKELKKQNATLLASETRAFMEDRLAKVGFRPSEALHSLHVLPRVAPGAIKNSIEDAHLIDTQSKLELDLNSILGAQCRSTFFLNTKQRSARVARKEQLLIKRQDQRVLNLQDGASERTDIVVSLHARLASLRAKETLKDALGKKNARPLRTELEPGTYDIVAIGVLDGDAFNLYLVVDTDARLTVAFKGNAAINAAIAAKRAELASLLNTYDHDTAKKKLGAFYMHGDHNLASIGTLTKSANSIRDAHGREAADCGIVVGGTVVTETQGQQVEAMQVDADADADAARPPTLVLTKQMQTSLKVYIADLFKPGADQLPRVLKVLKVLEASHYNHDALVFQVQEDVPGAEPVLAWGGPSLQDIAKLSKDCYLIVHKVLKKSFLNVTIVAAADMHWTHRLPLKYEAIPAIQKGSSHVPATIAIEDTTTVKGNPVLMDTEGKFWRFAFPQTIKPNPARNMRGLVFKAGLVLDTASFTLSEP